MITNKDKFQIPYFIASLSDNSNTPEYKHLIHNHKDKFLNSGRLMVKIQDGCLRFCSYCIVPYLRGKPVSKSIHEIIKEIKMYEKNIKEVILTAINTEYFGDENNESLMKLLDAIRIQTGIPRISLGSIHPWSITSEFLSWYKHHASDDRFVHYFHIPIQSGSDTILNLMNRGYSAGQMLNRLNQLRTINLHALIGTDVIVGFPGKQKKNFIKRTNF